MSATGTAIVLGLLAATAGAPGLSGSPPAPASPRNFAWCGNSLRVDLDRWGDLTGIPTVFGWSYLYYNAHSAALRVDGTEVWDSNQSPWTSLLQTTAVVADPATATGLVVYTIPWLARIELRLSGLERAGCCELATEVRVQNLDSVPHVFEFRWFHDTAFGEYQTCPSPSFDRDVDGGPVCLPGEVVGSTCRRQEVDARAEGAGGCGRPIAFYSSDTGRIGPVYVFDDTVNAPEVTEIIAWEARALEPALNWSGLVNGQPIASCDDDVALLVGWRLPRGSGALAPGESSRFAWRIGNGCEPACCTLAEDAGPSRSICQGDSVSLGATPTAWSGVPPYQYRWTPNDGTLSDPTAANPVATPPSSRRYTLETTDAAGCLVTASVDVAVVPDLTPGPVGNTLLAVRTAAGADLVWGAAAGADSYLVRGALDKPFVTTTVLASGLAAPELHLALGPAPLHHLRAFGASCSGREGR